MKAWKVALVNDESADQVMGPVVGAKRKAVSIFFFFFFWVIASF
jgi:hypothetical protein